MSGLGKLIWVQSKLFLRDPFAFFFTLAFPAILLVVFGAIFGNEPLVQWGITLGYVDIQVPGLAAIIIGSVALIGIPIGTAAERESGVLRRYRATPLRPATYIVAQVTVYFAMCLLGMLLLILIAVGLYGLRFEGSAMAVLLAFTYAAAAFFAAGYLIASLSPSARVAQSVGMALFFPLMFLSGAAMPLQIMPENVRAFARRLPLSQIVELLQGLWTGEPAADQIVPLLYLGALLAVGSTLAVRFFRWE